jgi:hypothetical protein
MTRKILRGQTVALVAMVFGLGACTSDPSETEDQLPQVKGVVVSAAEPRPLEGVSIDFGQGEPALTDANGAFTLRNVPETGSISSAMCGYESASVAAQANVQISLKPEIQEGRVLSNLTRKGIKAKLEINRQSVGKSVRDGRFQIEAACPGDEVVVSARGYEPNRFVVANARTVDVILVATPATSLRQQIEWESRGIYAKAWKLVHPDAHSYITKSQWVQFMKDEALGGYQLISVDVHDVRIIKWTFPVCRAADYGPRTYGRTAALRVTYHEAIPLGLEEATAGLLHMVRTSDEHWRFFPIVGCDFKP